MAQSIDHLGENTDIDVLEQLVDVSGAHLIDVGCGGGDLARALAERGARVLAIEPDPTQAERNRAAPPTPGVTFEEAQAQALPVADNTVDGAVFGRSLHHVPASEMGHALSEACRAVKPGGFVYVMEPVMEGAFSEVQKPFHDETQVRQQARDAMVHAAPLFESEQEVHYKIVIRFESYDAFVERFAGMSYNDYGADEVRSDTVRALFEVGRTATGDYEFKQPMRVNLFRVAAE